MNGWKNRATWLYNVHNDNWVDQNESEIALSVSQFIRDERLSYETSTEFLDEVYGLVRKAISNLLTSEIDMMIDSIETSLIRTQRDLGEGLYNFMIDMVDVRGTFFDIDTEALIECYGEDYMYNLRKGYYRIDDLDELLEAERNAAHELVTAS